MQVTEVSVYRGPNLYSGLPMIRIQLDLGPLEAWPSNTLPQFNDRLLERLPGLSEHGCCYRERGGFVRRLQQGTWLGHVIEHVALELQSRAGFAVTRGKTRSQKGRPGVYNILYRYESEDVGLLAGRLAVEMVHALLPAEHQGLEGAECLGPRPEGLGDPPDIAVALAELEAVARRGRLGPTTASIVNEARRRGIPVTRLNNQSLVQLGWGARQKRIRASITSETSLIGVETAGDKDLTKRLLRDVRVATPKGAVVRTADDAVAAASRLSWPVVTKPLDGNHGRGVSLGLRTPDAVRRGFEQAARHSRRVIVEEEFEGRDHRILVVGGKVVAVAERKPAHVVGNGQDTISALIERVNADPRRGGGHEAVMTRIAVDDHVTDMLARAGMGVDSVPLPGQLVTLRATANLSTGGTATDRTDEIHPDNAAMARRAAVTVGLDVAGIDFIAPDISRSVRETGGGVVEVNAAPGFRMHLAPSEGRPRDVARAVVDQLFPRGTRSRIPIVGVTGSNGKSTVGRMVTAILRQDGLRVGLTNTSGVYIDGERVFDGDASGPRSARLVLRDPTVDAAVLEMARGGILREGLAVDRCDVGIVTNIAADHLGLKGVDSLQDLADVKSVVTEAVGRRGLSVLNGDDPLTLRMARHAGGRVAYFTLSGGHEVQPLLQKHVAEGGLLVSLEPSIHGGLIVLQDGARRLEVMEAGTIPATLGAAARFNIANAMAAIAAAHGLRVPLATMIAALRAFQSTFEQNPGRLNVHDAYGIRFILDYAHNPAALRAIGDMLERMRPRHERLICVASIPGDRRDDDIREMGAVAAGIFDEVIFRERPDGRGRPAGSVMQLLTEGALSVGAAPARLRTIACEHAAVEAALSTAREGDLVVLMPTRVEEVWRQVLAFRPTHGWGAASLAEHVA